MRFPGDGGVRARSRAGGRQQGGADPDDALLQRVGQGDRDAFGALYDRFGAHVYGLARRVVVDPSLAEEVSQDVFVNVWQGAHKFDPASGHARTWILTITHRRAVDRVRREQHHRDRLTRGAALNYERSYDVVADDVLRHAAADSADLAVSRALLHVTPLQREAIDLAYFGGFTNAEVAALLNIPIPTAKSRIREGLLCLAAHLPRNGYSNAVRSSARSPLVGHVEDDPG